MTESNRRGSRERIEALRRRIDAIDEALLELLVERAELVLEIGDIKAQAGLAVYCPDREDDIIARLTRLSRPPLSPSAIERVFMAIFAESRRLEHGHQAWDRRGTS